MTVRHAAAFVLRPLRATRGRERLPEAGYLIFGDSFSRIFSLVRHAEIGIKPYKGGSAKGLTKPGNTNREDIAKTLAVFGGFTEGLQLFASFAILLNFPRFNKMKGMGQIVTWSARDESLHTNSIIRLYRTFVNENPSIRTPALEKALLGACETVVSHEDAFIDLAFEMGGVEGLGPEEVKAYIRYIADRRLTQLELAPRFGFNQNPLPWMDEMLNGIEHTNFFENRATEYSKAATRGTWEEAFA